MKMFFFLKRKQERTKGHQLMKLFQKVANSETAQKGEILSSFANVLKSSQVNAVTTTAIDLSHIGSLVHFGRIGVS